MWEKEKLLVTSNFFSFPTAFSTSLEKFLPFSSNLKLFSANSSSLEESKVCHLGKGYDIYMIPKKFFENDAERNGKPGERK